MNCRLHEKPLILICLNPYCGNPRLLCKGCVDVLHNRCLHYIIEVEDIMKGDLKSVMKLLQDENILQVYHLMSQSGLKEDEQILAIVETSINNEFTSFLNKVLEQVHKMQEKIISNIRNSYKALNFSFERFKGELGKLFNFDEARSILESFFSKRTDIETITAQLSKIFTPFAQKKQEKAELIEMAKSLNSFLQEQTKMYEDPLNQLKKMLSFEGIDSYCFSAQPWSLDRINKTPDILLDKAGQKAAKSEESFFSNSVVLGTSLFNKGYHQWTIEVTSGYPGHSWIKFGVVDTKYISNLEDFPDTEALSLDTQGNLSRMKPIRKIQNYDNVRYVCTLDMDEGAFNISYEGKVIAEQIGDLKGKKLLPFVMLGYPGNRIKIQVIRFSN